MYKVIAVLLVLVSLSLAQTKKPDPPKYVPNKEQSLELEIARLKALNARQQYDIDVSRISSQMPSFQAYQKSMSDLQQKCIDIEKENNWPTDTVQCVGDIATSVTFSEKPGVQKQEEKKPEVKK
jgi:hypothetical protein